MRSPWSLLVGVASEIVSHSVYPDTDAQLQDEHVIAICEEVIFTLRCLDFFVVFAAFAATLTG